MTRGCAMLRIAPRSGNQREPVSRAEKIGERDLCRGAAKGAVLCRGVAPAYFIAALRGEYALTAPGCGQWHENKYRLGQCHPPKAQSGSGEHRL